MQGCDNSKFVECFANKVLSASLLNFIIKLLFSVPICLAMSLFLSRCLSSGLQSHLLDRYMDYLCIYPSLCVLIPIFAFSRNTHVCRDLDLSPSTTTGGSWSSKYFWKAHLPIDESTVMMTGEWAQDIEREVERGVLGVTVYFEPERLSSWARGSLVCVVRKYVLMSRYQELAVASPYMTRGPPRCLI